MIRLGGSSEEQVSLQAHVLGVNASQVRGGWTMRRSTHHSGSSMKDDPWAMSVLMRRSMFRSYIFRPMLSSRGGRKIGLELGQRCPRLNTVQEKSPKCIFAEGPFLEVLVSGGTTDPQSAEGASKDPAKCHMDCC